MIRVGGRVWATDGDTHPGGSGRRMLLGLWLSPEDFDRAFPVASVARGGVTYQRRRSRWRLTPRA